MDTFNHGEERADILEIAFTGFIAVTNVREDALPPLIRVDIYPDEGEFRKKLHVSGWDFRTSSSHIETYEHKELNNVLVRETAEALFYAVTGTQRARPFAWLRNGISSAVIGNAARVDPQESRRRARIALIKAQPIDFDTLVGREEVGGDVKKQARYRDTASSLISYLLAQDKGLGLKVLLTNIGAGEGLDDAIAKAYPGRFRSMDELYDRWLWDELGMVRPPGAKKAFKALPSDSSGKNDLRR